MKKLVNRIMRVIGVLWGHLVFKAVRRLGFEPTTQRSLNSAVMASIQLSTYIQISGALQNLFHKNPRAFKRILHLTEQIHGALIMDMSASAVDSVRENVVMASNLSQALLANQRLHSRVVDLERQLEATQGNERAIAA